MLARELSVVSSARWSRCSATTTTSRASADEVRRILQTAGVHRPRRRGGRGARRRLRRRQGVLRRLRPRLARRRGASRRSSTSCSEALDEAHEARVGARPTAHAPSHRDAALRADRRHRRGRAAGDLSLSRQQPARRSAAALSGGLRGARPRAPRRAEGARSTACRSTTWPSRCCTAPSPIARHSACSACRPANKTEPRRARCARGQCLHPTRGGPACEDCAAG